MWRNSARVILTIVLLSRLAPAEKTDPVVAEALFRAGRDAADHGDPTTALARFSESYRLDPAVGTLINVAECEALLGRVADAWEHYHRAEDGLGRADERSSLVRDRLIALTPRLSSLVLSPRRKEDSIVVLRDGVRLTRTSFGIALPVNPGSHELVVSALHRSARRYSVSLIEGETRQLVLESGPPEAAKRKPVPTERKVSDPALRNAAMVVLGAAGAFAVTSGILAWQTAEARSRIEAHCPTPRSCDDAGLRAVGAAESWQTGAVVAASVAAAGAIGGFTLLWLGTPLTSHAAKTGGIELSWGSSF